MIKIIDRDGYQKRCLDLGAKLFQGLEKLKAKYPVVGDVRGKGLMVALELVKDRKTKEPAKEACAAAFEKTKELGLLIGKGGLFGNTLRITPPMCFTEADVEFTLDVLDVALGETG